MKDDKTIDYIPDETSIAAFRERVPGMIGSVCANEFVAKPSFIGCQRCGYGDLCEVGGWSGECIEHRHVRARAR